MGEEPAKISRDLKPIGSSSTGKYAQAKTSKENKMNIYVGNIASEAIEDDLMEAFSQFGHVESAKIIKDKFSGESRGFGFVAMLSDEEAKTAIDELNGKDLKGKNISCKEARPRKVNHKGSGRRGGFGSRGRGSRGVSRGGSGRGGNSRGGNSRGGSRGGSPRGGSRGRYR